MNLLISILGLNLDEWAAMGIAYVSANALTLVGLVLFIVKQKVKEGNLTNALQKKMVEHEMDLSDKQLETLNKFEARLMDKINEACEGVIEKKNELNEELKKASDEAKLELNESIKGFNEKTQSALDIINEE